MVRKRQTGVSEPSKLAPESSSTPKMSSSAATVAGGAWSARTQWMFFAVASGACAAFNGVFAKLYVVSSSMYEKEAGLMGNLEGRWDELC